VDSVVGRDKGRNGDPKVGPDADRRQFALPQLLSPPSSLILLPHPYQLLLSAPPKYLDGFGKFIAHALLDLLRALRPPCALLDVGLQDTKGGFVSLHGQLQPV
jgi:hypothetical protein